MKFKHKLLWITLGFFAILIGCYPLIYGFVDMHNKGLLQSKSPELLHYSLWRLFFYTHISFGGLALSVGWIQFSSKLRKSNLNFHRWVGRVYVIAVLLSSIAGLYIAYFASGGLISVLGFSSLGLLWFYTDVKAYITIHNLDIQAHKRWMIRNYALTFAAVTLRIWLPLMMLPVFNLGFLHAYPIVAWLCWVPNLIIAEIIWVNKN